MDPDATLKSMVELVSILDAVRDSRDFGARERYDPPTLEIDLMRHAEHIRSWVDCGGFRPRADAGTVDLITNHCGDWFREYVEVVP
jgi:hypothetical protein